MNPEVPVPMVRCRVDGTHLRTSIHYVPEQEFDAWRHEMEARYRRVVTVNEISAWVPQAPEILRNTTDPDTLHPVLKVRFERRGPRGESVPVLRFLSTDDHFEAGAARLAGLETTLGYFLSSVPMTLYVAGDDADVESAPEEELELVAADA